MNDLKLHDKCKCGDNYWLRGSVRMEDRKEYLVKYCKNNCEPVEEICEILGREGKVLYEYLITALGKLSPDDADRYYKNESTENLETLLRTGGHIPSMETPVMLQSWAKTKIEQELKSRAQ